MVELKQYGAENIGMYEADRRLFWTRLTLKGKKGLQFLTATVHSLGQEIQPSMTVVLALGTSKPERQSES